MSFPEYSRRKAIKMIAVSTAAVVLSGCLPKKTDTPESTRALPTPEPSHTPSPTPSVWERALLTGEFLLSREQGLPEVIEHFPLFDTTDPYYPWYRHNGGQVLLEPLAIPAGTVLKVPIPDITPFSLPEIVEPPEKWENTLAEHGTSLKGSSERRLFNIRLGVERLNGTVVEPYRLFSMQEAIGPTTIAGGYQMGFGYQEGEEVPMEAGGVCQVPSTLFYPAAKAGLLIIQRYAHDFYWSNYGPWDATISESLDFTFRNLFDFPIQIRARIDKATEKLMVGIWSPFPAPYDEINLETLKNLKNADGSRDSLVRQTVRLGQSNRVRDYSSHYLAKK